MFRIVTGSPGSSKSLNVIKEYKDVRDRPVFYCNIKILDFDALPWTELTPEQVYDWRSHIPEGSILIVDEAQKIFPVRHSSKAVPPGLSALEDHRHYGFDVVFITPHPLLLDNHARLIVNEHVHYSRPFQTTKQIIRYTSHSGFVDPSHQHLLDKRCSIDKNLTLDESIYPLYESSSIHTHVEKPPRALVRFKRFAIAFPFIVIGCLAFAGWLMFKPAFDDSDPPDPDISEKPSTSVPQRSVSDLDVVDEMRSSSPSNRFDWKTALQPAIPGLPWTAPLYSEKAKEVKSVPRLAACIQSKNSCNCFTQQATPINGIPPAICRSFVKHGQFDHMIEGEGESDGGARAPTDPPPAPATEQRRPTSVAAERVRRANEIYDSMRF